jgi:hypothetical protein
MRTIDSILEENNVKNIDLISIDIDGSEIFALPNLNLSKWKPTLLVLEWSVVGRDFIDTYAKNHGYHKALEMGADTFYCLNEKDVELITNLRPLGNKISREHPSEIYFK